MNTEWKKISELSAFKKLTNYEVSSDGAVRFIIGGKEVNHFRDTKGRYRVRLHHKSGYMQPNIDLLVKLAFDKTFKPILSNEALAANRVLDAVLSSEFKTKKEFGIALKYEIETIRRMK